MSEEKWYYVIKDRQNGPVSFEGLLDLFRSGTLTGESYIWREGWDNWKHAGEVSEIVSGLTPPAPQPTPVPPQPAEPQQIPPNQPWAHQTQTPQLYSPQPWAVQPPAPERPTSLTVFGILNIVFGSLGLIALPCSIIASFIPSEEMHPEITVTIFSIIAQLVGLVMAIILLTSGIGLLHCKDSARRMAIGYGIFSIIWNIAGTIVNLVFVSLGMYHMVDDALAPIIMIGSCASLVSLIYPILLIIFMKKQNVKDACK